MTTAELFDLAQGHHKSGRLREAETIYRRLLEADPSHAACNCALGYLFHQLGNHETALALIRRAIFLAPAVALYHLNLGMVLKHQGQLAAAITCYGQALSLDPQHVQGHNLLGIALGEQGRHDEAETAFRRALQIQPDLVDAHINLAIILQGQGKLDEAAAELRHALRLRPDSADAYNNLGIILKDRGNHDDAAACYEQAIALNPTHAEAFLNLGCVLKEQGRLDAAAAQFEHALALKPSFAVAHKYVGEILIEEGKPADAAARFQRYLELEPTDCQGVRLLMAGIGFGPMPERASELQLQRLYAWRAHAWRAEGTNAFRGHTLVADAFHRLCKQHEKLSILDAGCGTGFVGQLVRDRAHRLEGIDLSQDMLSKAKEKDIYDQLHRGDLVAFMARHPKEFDVITCAATLIHFGTLSPVFHAAAIALRGNGLLIGTLFANENEEPGSGVAVAPFAGLAQSGCFCHGSNYIRQVAEENGLRVEVLDKEIHEHHKGTPVLAYVIALRRDPLA